MSPTIDYVEQLTTTTCWCGIHLAIPSNLYRQATEVGKKVYCPLGHTFVFGETELDRERKARELAQKQALRAEQRRMAERDLREHTERQLRAQKAATTKARKRAAAGVCPCCKRSFANVRRHMDSKHPRYDPAKEER